MSDPVEKQLLEFLAWEAQKRQRGLTDEELHRKIDVLHRAQQQILNDRLEDRATLQRHGRRLGKLEHQVALMSSAPPMTDVPDWRPDPRDITGSHDFALIKAQHEEMLEDAKWSRRQRWIVAGTIFAALVVATISGCVTYAVSHVNIAPPATRSP